jgi:PKD repeat protein
MVFEDCTFRDNGGYGVQLGGPNVDALAFLRCAITGNGQAAVTEPFRAKALEFTRCKVQGNQSDRLPAAKPFHAPAPTADFRVPESIRIGELAQFQCLSQAASGEIVERLWDFGEGIPEIAVSPKHTFLRPGTYQVTLVVWDAAGRGSRASKSIKVDAFIAWSHSP